LALENPRRARTGTSGGTIRGKNRTPENASTANLVVAASHTPGIVVSVNESPRRGGGLVLIRDPIMRPITPSLAGVVALSSDHIGPMRGAKIYPITSPI
jgi:hypothetical protein